MSQQADVMLVAEEANMSLEHIMASELYPKKPLTADEEALPVPFPVLPGESVEYLGKTDGGVIALSNFRLFIRFKESFINIPLGLIESVEYRDIFYINIYCKDAHSLRCTLPTNEACLEWYKRLTAALQVPKKLQDVFAFAFRAWCVDPTCGQQGAVVEHGIAYQLCNAVDMEGGYSFGREVERMGFDLKNSWRICYINEDYKVCESYPKEHLVPACMTDRELKSVANFRASHRFPSVSWRDQVSGAVIARSSQPEVGWLGWRNVEDERLLQAISAACAINTTNTSSVEGSSSGVTEPKKMLIIDARSYAAAWANRAKGGGCECTEYYPNCEIQFMSLANIHTVRKSFYAVRALCALAAEQSNWLASVENTKWLSHISLLMRSALLVVNAIDREARPVLVHCSDGWDRTPQIVALAKLMLDPHYRTIQGFRVLVEQEWLAFGHKFADRCGNGLGSDDLNERCPVFLQWLDCIHQLILQFPCSFQFNEAFLVKLVHHVYSALFGTFLGNNVAERQEGKVPQQTNSVWSLLLPTNRKFVNLLYKTDTETVLRPSCHMRQLQLWQAVYLSETAPAAAMEPLDLTDDSAEVLEDTSPGQAPLVKTRSCEDLPTAADTDDEGTPLSRTRRLSDPHITTDPNTLLQSTDSIDTDKTVTSTCVEATVCDNQISNGVSSETLTEVNGVIPEGTAHSVKAHSENSEPDSAEHNTRSDACSNEDDECDTSEYGIARIDSAHDVTELALDSRPQNGLVDHIGGSTDTLTDDPSECHIQQQTCDSEHSTSSHGHSAISATNKVVQNGHVLTNGHDKDLVTHKVHKNHGHHVDCRPGNNVRLHNEGITPFRLEDVLSKLDIESLLDANSRFKDSIEMNGLGQCISRGSSSGQEDTTDHGSTSSYHSRTPNSTGPPTPGTDLKGSPWTLRHHSSLGRHLDCDGLTTFVDPVQSRLAEIESDYEQKIHELKQQLNMAKAVIYQCAAGVNGTGKHMDSVDDMVSTECTDAGEHGSLGGGSTAASDVSWEEVEEGDARMTLWVPDHAVTHCAGCDQMFWVVRRKHHCRNCGQVFCGECTKYYRPLPDQHLPDPQRVCVNCYRSASAGLAAIIADSLILDNNIKQDGAMASA